MQAPKLTLTKLPGKDLWILAIPEGFTMDSVRDTDSGEMIEVVFYPIPIENLDAEDKAELDCE